MPIEYETIRSIVQTCTALADAHDDIDPVHSEIRTMVAAAVELLGAAAKLCMELPETE